MNLPDNDPDHVDTRTFFYVFVDKSPGPNRSGPLDEAASESSSSEHNGLLDWRVTIAFKRFAREFSREAKVDLNPAPYHSIRTAFGIQELPAFGIADLNLRSQRSLSSDPPKLPSWWNPFGRGERKRMLSSEKFLPKVERAVVARYANADDLYHFLRDLHIANIDQGLQGVAQKIEGEIRAIGGKKLLNAVSIGKKVVVGW